MSDLTLFDAEPVFVRPEPCPSIDEQFAEFDRCNPWVFTALRDLALDMVSRGHRKIGIGMLFEVLRWEHARATSDPNSSFKLNNNLRSRFARKLMAEVPALEGVFDTRELRAA